MRKIFIVFLILICGPVFATSMCVNDDTVAVVLDASISGTGGSFSSISTGTGDWNTIFSYGRVYAVGACVSSNKGNVVTYLTDTIDGMEQEIVGGERNGGICYIRLIHPVVSSWVLGGNYGNNCAGYCVNSNNVSFPAGRLRTDTSFRMSVFGSIAQ